MKIKSLNMALFPDDKVNDQPENLNQQTSFIMKLLDLQQEHTPN